MHQNATYAAILTILVVSAALPGPATAQTAVQGIFVDDGHKLSGAANLALAVTGTSMSGTITVANQTLSVSAAYSKSTDIAGTVWSNYDGTVTVGGLVRPVRVHHDAANGSFVAAVTKSDLGNLVVYGIADSARMGAVADVVLETRQDYAYASAYDLHRSIPDFTPKITPPSLAIQVDPSMATGVAGATLGGIWTGVVPENGDSHDEGNMEARWGPRNREYVRDPYGAQMQYHISAPYRDVRYAGSFDEVRLDTPFYKRLTVAAWSSGLASNPPYYYETSGSLRFELVQIPYNWMSDVNPIAFFEVGTEPTNGYTSPVSFSASIGYGYGPIGFDIGVSYQDQSNGASVYLSDRRVVAEVEWEDHQTPPTAKELSMGGRVGLGARSGADGNYDMAARLVFAYYRERAIWGQGLPIYHELTSSPSYVESGTQASWSYDKANNKLANVRDYDVGDRTGTPTVHPGGTPGARTNWFLRPWPGETRHANAWWLLEGPICEHHRFAFYVIWFDEVTQQWHDVDVETLDLWPVPGQCKTDARLWYDLLITTATPVGHYQVYLLEAPNDETLHFRDVADFFVAGV